ncbi:hypothetical protein FSP39_012047 [Pinctada imbricata]|uniref:SH3 domain-containing protein n=1 Tax=Pinctada imbricata TaxID=66713 RepID=A0AA88Y8N0_PINIB|nr:hypothetical protein FSP39_012047 [Pinctada imbricata]
MESENFVIFHRVRSEIIESEAIESEVISHRELDDNFFSSSLIHLPSSSTPLEPTPVLPPMMSSSVAPPIVPTSRPTLPSSGGNISSTGIPGTSSCILQVQVNRYTFMSTTGASLQKEDGKIQTQDMWVSRPDIQMTPALDTLTTIESVTESGVAVSKVGNGHAKAVDTNKDEGEKYKVLYPYQAQGSGQLDLEREDVVTVTERDENGWWKGKLGDKEGWFPGSYVKPVAPPTIEKKPSIRVNDPQDIMDGGKPTQTPAPVSTFKLSKDLDRRLTSPVHRESPVRRESSHIRSSPVRTDSRVLGKEVSIPHLPNEEGISQPARAVTPVRDSQEINGKKFKVLYHYSPNYKEEITLEVGEIVTGIVKERNGWMKGRRDKTNEVGWFPAVYVDRATEEDVKAAIVSQLGYEDEAAVYQLLNKNQSVTSDGDVMGIEHTATCPYAAENDHDLSFDIGDTIIVYETHDNGWWLGSHGEDVGWFPGAYVEMEEEDKVSNKKHENELSPTSEDLAMTTNGGSSTQISKDSAMATYGGSGTHLSVSSVNMSRLSMEKSDDEHSISSASTGTVDSKTSKRRPVRKAPPPPEGAKSPRSESKLPTPTQTHGYGKSSSSVTESTPNPKSDRKSSKDADRSRLNISNISGASDTIDGKCDTGKKPEIPKRYIKPKLHKVSRRKIDLHDAKTCDRATKSPPPPRPEFPKHIPKSPLRKNSDMSANGEGKSEISNANIDSDFSVDTSKLVTDSDLSGVEQLDLNNSEKSEEFGKNKNEENKESKVASTPQSPKQQSRIPTFSKQISLSKAPQVSNTEGEIDAVNFHELNDNKQSHSTPKVKDVPKFNDMPKAEKQNVSLRNNSVDQSVEQQPQLHGVKPSDSVKSNNIVHKPDSAKPDSATPDTAKPDSATPDSATPDSATPDSITTNSATVPEKKSLSKIPQSPKQSRLPRYGKDSGASRLPMSDRSSSPSKKPPVAPKPKRPSHSNNNDLPQDHDHLDSSVSIDSASVSNVEDSKEASAVMSDDKILVSFGLDSSTNDSNLVNDSRAPRAATPSKSQSGIPTRGASPQKPHSSRIPKGPGVSPKKDSSHSEIPRKSEIPKYSSQISSSSQDSNVFEEDNTKTSPVKPKRTGKPPEAQNERTGKQPETQNEQVQTKQSRKTSASPSRIPKGTSPAVKKKNESPSKLPTAKSKNNSGEGSNKQKSSLPVLRPSRPPPPATPPATPPAVNHATPSPVTPPAKVRRTNSPQDMDLPVR